MKAIVKPAEEIREMQRRRRIHEYMRQGMTADQAVRAAVAVGLIQQARDAKLAQAAHAAGGELPTTAPSPIVYKDTAVDRVAIRIKDHLLSQSSEQAHRLAVETAQRTEREKNAQE